MLASDRMGPSIVCFEARWGVRWGKSNAVSCCYIGMEVWSRVSRKLLTYEEL
jgi:hypothetical protein